MKNILTIFLLVFAVTFTTQAQKREARLSNEQLTILKVKKMTLKLDLNDKQQKAVAPLIAKQIESKKAHREHRMTMKKANKKPTSDEIFEMKKNHLDVLISMKAKMKQILTKEQYEKFEKMAHHKAKRLKKKMKHKKGKKRKHLDTDE